MENENCTLYTLFVGLCVCGWVEVDVLIGFEWEINICVFLCFLQRRGSCGVPIPVSLILVFAYLCGGAGIFWWLEDWPFVDAIFFCFASLATIGFGGMLDPHLSKHVSGVERFYLSTDWKAN